MTEQVLTEDRGRVRILRINRPEQHNCVDGETAEALGHAIEAFAADGEMRVLVVTGAGERAFCAGADLKNAVTPFGGGAAPRAGRRAAAGSGRGTPALRVR